MYVQNGLGDRVFAIPTTPVEIDQKGCLYAPRIAGAQVGQTVRYVNGDALLHNVHGTPKDSSAWNVSLPRRGAEREIRVDHAEVMVSVRCDLHPWMQGWLGVLDHPYFAVTDADGRFTLRDVPPGDYTLAVWHERLGAKTTRVTVAPKGAAETRFTLTAALSIRAHACYVATRNRRGLPMEALERFPLDPHRGRHHLIAIVLLQLRERAVRGTLDRQQKVVPQLRPRALYWFAGAPRGLIRALLPCTSIMASSCSTWAAATCSPSSWSRWVWRSPSTIRSRSRVRKEQQ